MIRGFVKRGIMLGLLLTSMVILSSCGKEEMDGKDLFDIQFTGSSGKGIATVEFNDELYEDTKFLDSIFPDDTKKRAAKNLKFIEETLMVTMDKEDGLSNGDVVTISIEVDDEEILEDYAIKLTNQEFEVTVSDLKELELINPFEGVTINYSGVAPFGSISFDDTNAHTAVRNYVSFSVDNMYNYSNGDTVEVTATVYNEYLFEEEGYGLSEETKTFTIENAPTYLSDMTNIDKKELDSEISDHLTQKAVITSVFYTRFMGMSESEDYKSIKSSKLYSSHFLKIKDRELDSLYRDSDFNKYIEIYEYTLELEDGKDVKYYVPVQVTGLYNDQDGKLDWYDIYLSDCYEKYSEAVEDYINQNKVKYIDTDIVAAP